jgi:hypothetical protein
MTTFPHEPTARAEDERWWVVQLRAPEMWASLAIAVMWLSVLFTAIWGASIVTANAGGNNSNVPSAVVVALFAFLGTWVVARRGFRLDRKD